MKIPLVDLQAQYDSIKQEIDEAVRGVIDKSQFILGPEVGAFEREIADYLGVAYAVGVASGTDALLLALLASGIRPGDEVITTPFTFISTSEVIVRCGATPVFVDIDPETYNIDPDKIEQKITSKTRAILPVHLFGQSADMAPVLDLAEKYNLKIVEDCAQALGTSYRGKRAGSLGDAGCLSFFPSKVLGCYGDGGMVITDKPEIAESLTMLRNHGGKEKYYYLIHGFNSRLDALQAAVLRVKLKHIDDWIQARREKALLYMRLLDGVEGIELPSAHESDSQIFYCFTIRLTDKKRTRDGLVRHLNSQGIATAVYYPLSLHLQPVYKSLDYKAGDLPVSEKAQEEVISLPIYPELSEEQIEYIVNSVLSYR